MSILDDLLATGMKPEHPSEDELAAMRSLRLGDYEILSEKLVLVAQEGKEVMTRLGISSMLHSGDTLVGGAGIALRDARPGLALAGSYAGDAFWYRDGRPIFFENNQYGQVEETFPVDCRQVLRVGVYEGVPVFNTVEQAVGETGANASDIFVPPPFAADAIFESLDGGKPIRESRDIDIPLAAAHFFYYAGWAAKLAYAFPGRTARSIDHLTSSAVISRPLWNFTPSRSVKV